jgi:dTDP-4-dehydrorhamnose reductase
MEQALLGAGGRDLIVRTGRVFAPSNANDFAAEVVRRLSGGHRVAAVDDVVVSPTYLPDFVAAALDLMIDGETGLWHLANRGALSWHGFAIAIAESLGLDPDLVRPISTEMADWKAKRPIYAPLGSGRGYHLPPLEEAISRYAAILREGGLGEAQPERTFKAAAA